MRVPQSGPLVGIRELEQFPLLGMTTWPSFDVYERSKHLSLTLPSLGHVVVQSLQSVLVKYHVLAIAYINM